MVTSILLIALIGTLQFHSAISAAINYEPIKITVNENFNAQPGQVFPELQAHVPGIFHQGANFYFKPQLNLPQSYIPSHIEALIPLMQQYYHASAEDTSKLVIEKDKLIEILKPFMYPLSDISKETLSKVVLEKENNLEIVKPILITERPKPVTPELLVIFEAPVLPPSSFNGGIPSVVEEVKKQESIILEEPVGVFPEIPELGVRPIMKPIINSIEPKPITTGLVVIPEAPALPLHSLNGIHVVKEDVKIEEPIVVDVELKPAIQELIAISETPVLPSLHDISSIIEEEEKKEESLIFEEPTGVFPTISEIDVGPITEPVINYVESKPITSELVVIPEVPVLSFNGVPPMVEEEVKKEESIILEESTDEFPTILEIDVGPVTEPIIDYDELKPITSELVVIPEAPVLPPLSFNSIPPIVEQEVVKEESVILEEPIGVFTTIPENAVTPITEPIINYPRSLEPKPISSELLVIPEAPVLPPLTLNGFPFVVEEESIILEKPTDVPPAFPEIDVRTIMEPIINNVKPKPITSPVSPPLSYNGIAPVVEEVKIEESVEESTGIFPSIGDISARTFPEQVIVSETTESLALNNKMFPVEEVKIEIPILLEESIEVFPPIAEISSGPTLQESSPEITDSYVLEEVSQPNPESVVTSKKTLPPTIISKPSNHLGVYNYVPFVSHLSNRAPKTKKLMMPNPASLERLLLKKHPFRLPVMPFPKFDLNAIKSSVKGNQKQFLYPTSYAHDVVEQRIAPNMAFKNYIRPNVLKGPRYL